MKKPIHLYRNNIEKCSQILQNKFKENPKLSGEKSLYFYNVSLLENRLNHLREVFTSNNVLHAAAIKTNNIPEVLSHIVNLGYGLEAASFEEVLLAKTAGCPNEKIIFDSPVKTRKEIQTCDQEYPGMYLNANCFAELERLKETNNLNIGIRINPLVDIKAPDIFNVSNNRSKFGIPISEKKKIIFFALNTNNISGLHVHAGSEIGNIKGHIEAIGVVYDLAKEINHVQKDKIRFIDIGGGFPANTKKGKQEGLDTFVKELINRCPSIFNDFKIMTEYGRFIHTHNSFVVSQVEYVLDHTDPNIILTHVGGDLFVREIYSSHPPFHEISILNEKGQVKEGKQQEYDIGGPLCFTGDFLKKNISLPKVEEKDLVIIADTGSNSISMWSGHCSREKIKVIIFSEINNINQTG